MTESIWFLMKHHWICLKFADGKSFYGFDHVLSLIPPFWVHFVVWSFSFDIDRSVANQYLLLP